MDAGVEEDTSDIWTEKALNLKLGILPNTLAIGTFRNVDVPLHLEILDEEPNVNLEEWDHVSLGYFSIKSGQCAVFGCTDYLPDAQKIEMCPGTYSAFSMAKELDSITEEWEEADDLYKVILWPSSANEYKAVKGYENT